MAVEREEVNCTKELMLSRCGSHLWTSPKHFKQQGTLI